MKPNKHIDLTPTEKRVFDILFKEAGDGPKTKPRLLCAALKMTPESVARTICRLHKKGWIVWGGDK